MKYWLCKDDVITNVVLLTVSLQIKKKINKINKADSISCFSYTRRLKKKKKMFCLRSVS